MSTLKTNTLSNAAGTKSVPVDTVVSGSAKAWVNFNGTGTVAIRQAFNVSSITDMGTGDYQINFTNALSIDYAAVSNGEGVNGVSWGGRVETTSLTASNYRVKSVNNAGTGTFDTAVVMSVAFR